MAAITLGYHLSTEEHPPVDLVRYARMAEDAGFDHLFLHQIGHDQKGFFEFMSREVMPKVGRQPATVSASRTS
ncbi:MAG TPA: hypothetical protein VF201_04750 [Nitrolancea sp.]